MVYSILGCMKSLLWATLILGVTFYVFGITFVSGVVINLDTLAQWNSSDTTGLREHFGSLGKCTLTLYMAIAGGRSWGEYYSFLTPIPWQYRFLFLVFLMFSIFAVLNIVSPRMRTPSTRGGAGFPLSGGPGQATVVEGAQVLEPVIRYGAEDQGRPRSIWYVSDCTKGGAEKNVTVDWETVGNSGENHKDNTYAWHGAMRGSTRSTWKVKKMYRRCGHTGQRVGEASHPGPRPGALAWCWHGDGCPWLRQGKCLFRHDQETGARQCLPCLSNTIDQEEEKAPACLLESLVTIQQELAALKKEVMELRGLWHVQREKKRAKRARQKGRKMEEKGPRQRPLEEEDTRIESDEGEENRPANDGAKENESDYEKKEAQADGSECSDAWSAAFSSSSRSNRGQHRGAAAAPAAATELTDEEEKENKADKKETEDAAAAAIVELHAGEWDPGSSSGMSGDDSASETGEEEALYEMLQALVAEYGKNGRKKGKGKGKDSSSSCSSSKDADATGAEKGKKGDRESGGQRLTASQSRSA